MANEGGIVRPAENRFKRAVRPRAHRKFAPGAHEAYRVSGRHAAGLVTQVDP